MIAEDEITQLTSCGVAGETDASFVRFRRRNVSAVSGLHHALFLVVTMVVDQRNLQATR